MNVNIPPELQESIAALAMRYRVTPEEVVRRAVVLYLKSEQELWDELKVWEASSAEALHLVLGDENKDHIPTNSILD
jgi:hypothetical protein